MGAGLLISGAILAVGGLTLLLFVGRGPGESLLGSALAGAAGAGNWLVAVGGWLATTRPPGDQRNVLRFMTRFFLVLGFPLVGSLWLVDIVDRSPALELFIIGWHATSGIAAGLLAWSLARVAGLLPTSLLSRGFRLIGTGLAAALIVFTCGLTVLPLIGPDIGLLLLGVVIILTAILMGLVARLGWRVRRWEARDPVGPGA